MFVFAQGGRSGDSKDLIFNTENTRRIAASSPPLPKNMIVIPTEQREGGISFFHPENYLTWLFRLDQLINETAPRYIQPRRGNR
jgi:hypothetical protein